LWIARWACSAFALLGAGLGVAAPTACPAVGDTSTCELFVGDTRVVVSASDADGGFFLLDAWEIGGVRQLAPGYSGFAFRDFSTAPELPVGALLEEATVDAETATISIRFRELVSGLPGPFSLSVALQVSEDSSVSALTRTITVRNEGASTAVSRVYDVMDLDLEGNAVDDAVLVVPNGPTIVQMDGDALAETTIHAGPSADGYEVGLCPPCELSDLLGSVTFDLANIATVSGPADFQSALSWNQKLAPAERFDVTVATSIASPEPGAAAAFAAALGLLLCRRACAAGDARIRGGPRRG